MRLFLLLTMILACFALFAFGKNVEAEETITEEAEGQAEESYCLRWGRYCTYYGKERCTRVCEEWS